MGREARVRKKRTIIEDDREIYANANDLKDFIDQCRRLESLGLVAPGAIFRPGD